MAYASRTGSRNPGGGFVFWILIAMGLGTFLPCVILPEWRHYQLLDMASQIEQHRLDVLQREVDHERRLVGALRGDPAVVARIAQRDLHFERLGSTAVPVGPLGTGEPSQVTFTPTPPSPPAVAARLASWLPDRDYLNVFCDEKCRPVVMALSVALIGLAFVLYGRHTARGAPPGDSGFSSRPRYHSSGSV